MRKLKFVLMALPFCVLAGCGGDALEGTYEQTTTVMGFQGPKQTVEFSSDYIIANGNKVKVDEWERKDDVVTARNKDGVALINVRVLDGGKRLEAVGGSDMAKNVFVRVD
ncbi:hypothetical protein OGV25_14390 [Pseudomonas sp. P1B16]|jgi:hypothetical protein|uniref:Lipoprotein n=1 Tax=Pseudomonas capeferrum TaxID=1495066 RepID=A0ABY7R2Z4_9PSED|nr:MULTISPECIES: hypothetical protein [Pseudomonas]KEY88870.1 hypothetical protein PC358_06990 [Pseudomonas capeferrum]KGI92784.1 hypothetical protein MD26_13705 [Pseudomonas sp. H2]MBC3480904.1 hypothetical protein [Pseudomonas sp. SWRI77]MBC3504601.1 hypothetical protein [Pseudomonas sp. SWRI59]MBC3508150.1 hypothetical protein [Pseudomonas sp. SWRI68]